MIFTSTWSSEKTSTRLVQLDELFQGTTSCLCLLLELKTSFQQEANIHHSCESSFERNIHEMCQ